MPHLRPNLALLFWATLALRASPVSAAASLTDDMRIESRVLGYALQYRVYVPDVPAGQALPALYVTDGSWYLEQGRMQELLDEMIAAGRIEPLLVVFVDARDPDHLRIKNDIQNRIGAPLYGTAYLEEPLEVSTSQGPVPHLVPPLEHPVALVHELLAYWSAHAASVNEALEVSRQMAPAQLPKHLLIPLI